MNLKYNQSDAYHNISDNYLKSISHSLYIINTIISFISQIKLLYSNQYNQQQKKRSNLMHKIHRHIEQNVQEQSEIQLMAANLYELKRQITQQAQHKWQYQEPEMMENMHKTDQQMQNVNNGSQMNSIDYIRDVYERYLRSSNLPKNHESKITMLLQEKISIGNAIALFEMIYYFKEALNVQILEEISSKAFQGLVNAEVEEQVRVYGELIAITGIENEQICQFMAENLIEQKIDFDLAFLVLSNQNEIGFAYLYDLANRDIINISQKILDFLSRTQSIIINIIIPNVLQDAISSNNYKYRDIALLILNRLGPIMQNSQYLQKLRNLIEDAAVDKKFLLATIRSTGLQGQKILIDIVQSKNYNQHIISLALGVMSWKIPSRPALRIKAIQYTLQNCFLPGKLYQYEGQSQPWDFQTQSCYDSLCLSSRDFFSQFQRFLKLGKIKKTKQINNKSLMKLIQILKLDQNQKIQISQEVIQTLKNLLKSKSNKIRQICLLQLGNIGVQAVSSMQIVSKCLWDSDSAIRSASCWTLSRICNENPPKRIQNRLNQLLKDNFWKVRTSACIAIGIIVRNPQNSTIQNLIKVLQDGSIPKTTICETLARIGAEELLLQILKGSSRNDFKLRQAIIVSFQNISLKTPMINGIVQQLLKFSRDQRIQTRQLCLVTLNALKSKVQEEGIYSIAYFNTKNLLPFYYCFLQDPSAKIRQIAAQSILKFGSQAELIFIQGMAKAQPLAKIQCIKCLGKLGVQNFRAIILGLRDEDERVRKVASETIIRNFEVDEIIEQFGERENHSISLICNLRQILSSHLKSMQLKQYLRSIVQGLQYYRKNGKLRYQNQNKRLNQ